MSWRDTKRPWSVIRCTSGQETAAAARLARLGYSGGWWPTKEVQARSGAKKRALAAAKKRGAIVPPAKEAKPYIPGYVFAPHEIDIERVKSDPEARLWMAALVVNGDVVRISDDDMCRMRDIPDRLREYVAQIEAQLKAEREARMPVVGGKARVLRGVFEGKGGTVKTISDDEKSLVIDTGSALGYVGVAMEDVEKVA